jgi:hypothetical protein
MSLHQSVADVPGFAQPATWCTDMTQRWLGHAVCCWRGAWTRKVRQPLLQCVILNMTTPHGAVCTMIHKLWTGEHLEGSACGVIQALSRNLPGTSAETHKNFARVASLPAGIRSEHLERENPLGGDIESPHRPVYAQERLLTPLAILFTRTFSSRVLQEGQPFATWQACPCPGLTDHLRTDALGTMTLSGASNCVLCAWLRSSLNLKHNPCSCLDTPRKPRKPPAGIHGPRRRREALGSNLCENLQPVYTVLGQDVRCWVPISAVTHPCYPEFSSVCLCEPCTLYTLTTNPFPALRCSTVVL